MRAALLILALAPVLAACGSSNDDNLEGLVNGCDPDSARNHVGQPVVTVNFGGSLGDNYEPWCLRMSIGSQLVFNGDFSEHPLVGGIVNQGQKVADPTSPFGTGTLSGTSKAFTLSTPGVFGFFCNTHGTDGMSGAVFVE